MSIIIEKRTRATIDDQWSNWSETTDTPPYNNTDLTEYRVANDINIDDLTNGTIKYDSNNAEYKWIGTGIFDTLVNAVVGNIKIEYDSGRIAGAEYANVYLGSLQTVINTAATLWMQQPETEAKIGLVKEQIAASQAETKREDSIASAKNAVSAEQKELLKKQQELTARQTKGFDDNAMQKLLKQTLDSWSVAYSVAQDSISVPNTINVSTIETIAQKACKNLGITI